VGAAVAMLPALALRPFGWIVQLAAAAIVTALSIWAADRVVSLPEETDDDPGWLVIDEAAGAMLAVVGLDLGPAVVAWLVFRTADIFKRAFPGVAAAERLPGGVGITADDLVAGAYGLAAGWILMGLV
jgi:phosphatidylglycerophosphatase A